MRFRLISAQEERCEIEKWIRKQSKRLFALMARGRHDEFNKTQQMIADAHAKIAEMKKYET